MNEIKKKSLKQKKDQLYGRKEKSFKVLPYMKNEKKKHTFRKSFQEIKPQERTFAITAAKI